MTFNLLDYQASAPPGIEAANFISSIRQRFGNFHKKGWEQFGGKVQGIAPTSRQVQMLKTLGYL